MSDATTPTSTSAAATPSELTPPPGVRIWFPAAIAALFGAVYVGIGYLDVPSFYIFFGRLLAVGVWLLLFLGWWIFNRRVPRRDRWFVLGGMIAVIVVATVLLHPSVRTLALIVAFYAVPAQLLGWTIWLATKGNAAGAARRNGMLAIAALAWAWVPLVRLDGLRGQGEAAFHWRWTPTGEEQFLAEKSVPAPSVSADAAEPVVAADGDWPAFRGPLRDGAVSGVEIRTDWNETPPKEIWKQRVGPGWSSIVVIGDRIYTQEQRGENEAVVCCDAATGKEIWVHEDKGRFDEAMGGVGPRATPTFADGRIYALGAKGLLNCLDAATGALVWSRDVTLDGQKKIPYWGFCSSPLVVDGKVIVFAGGGGAQGHNAGSDQAEKGADDEADDKDGKKADAPVNMNTLVAYDAETGELAWQAPSGSHSYSSPQLATIDGKEQVLFLSDVALQSADPATGETLWSFPTNAEPDQSMPSLQPLLLGGSDFLVNFNANAGLIRTDVKCKDGKCNAEQVWFSRGVKPFFNDFVRVGDALYGFDGSIFCSVDAKTGKRNWKGGRYGSGQVLLLADQPVLLVISEAGEAVLVAANPEKHEELGRFQAIEGKTWNHPTVVRGRLFVRNAEEMACYEL